MASSLAASPAAATFPGTDGLLAFSAIPAGESDREIFLANADGSNPQQLTFNNAHDEDPAWSPDGSRIVFSSQITGAGDLYGIDVDGGNLQQLTSSPRPEAQPAYSPFGTRIVYTMMRLNGAELYTVGADGTGRFRLTDTKQNESNPDWSPLGTHIAFDGVASGVQGIFTIEPDGTARKLAVTRNNAGVTDPSWSPDGKRFAVAVHVTGDPGANIWTVRKNGSGWKRWVKRPSVDIQPSWAPSGNRIGYLEIALGQRRLRAVRANGSINTLVGAGVTEPADPAWQRLPL